MIDERPYGPEIEELHEAVMEVIGDYIDFEYSFEHNEIEGNADEETLTLWEGKGLFEVTIERGYKQRADGPDMNYQGTHIEGDYDAYVTWLKEKWPGVYEEALGEWKMTNADRITDEDKAVIENRITDEDKAVIENG